MEVGNWKWVSLSWYQSVSRNVFFMETTRTIPFPWLFQLPEATTFLGLWPLLEVTSPWPLVTSLTEMLLLPQFIYYEDLGDYIGSTQVMEILSPSQVLISLAKFLLSREVICSQAPGFLDRCGSWHCSPATKDTHEVLRVRGADCVQMCESSPVPGCCGTSMPLRISHC